MQRKKKRFFRGGAGLSPAFCARLDSQALCLPCRKQENFATPILTPHKMALHWENPASTTPSLTPRPEIRPLKIGKLTPCEKPEVAGRAGCGAVYRPTPFHLLFFHTSVLLVNVWVMCAAQDSPQPRPLRGEKHPFPSRSSCASMRCLCRPVWACFFLFLPISGFSQPPLSPSGDALVSSHLGLATAPGFAHNWVTHLQQGWSGAWVVLLPYPAL